MSFEFVVQNCQLFFVYTTISAVFFRLAQSFVQKGSVFQRKSLNLHTKIEKETYD